MVKNISSMNAEIAALLAEHFCPLAKTWGADTQAKVKLAYEEFVETTIFPVIKKYIAPIP